MGDGGAGDAGNERTRDKRRAGELEHSHREEKGDREIGIEGGKGRQETEGRKGNPPCPMVGVHRGALT